MTVFADTSALVTLYADERDHEVVRALREVVVAQVSRVEVVAALWSKSRTGELSTAAAGLLVADFEADYRGVLGEEHRFEIVSADAALLERAARLCGTHGLRAYDAVQLASALAVAGLEPGGGSMAVFDHQLRTAAAREGLTLVPA